MKNIVIAISDDIDIFESVDNAERYFETWILDSQYNFRVFDQNGFVFKASLKGKFLKLAKTNEKNVNELKAEIVRYLPGFKEDDFEEMQQTPLEKLVDFLIAFKGYTE